MITTALALALGAFFWTFLEYVLHRFVFHERILGAAAAKEHLQHHARVDWFATWRAKSVPAVVILPISLGLAWIVAGASFGVPFVAGILGGFAFYEILHRRIHRQAPRGAYARWARRHHLFHHFQDPKSNHGVTSPLWDWAFGTLRQVEEVRVPRKFAHTLPWLVDGEKIRAAYASSYTLR